MADLRLKGSLLRRNPLKWSRTLPPGKGIGFGHRKRSVMLVFEGGEFPSMMGPIAPSLCFFLLEDVLSSIQRCDAACRADKGGYPTLCIGTFVRGA